MGKYIALVALFLTAAPALASSCLMPSVAQDLRASKVVVAAQVRGVSVVPHPREPGKYRQTILWRVHEAWKGPHRYGRDFTTRTTLNCPTCTHYKVAHGRLMVLYLRGAEPYVLPWCSRTNFLEHSLKDVPLLYKLSGSGLGT
ncbi:hypothetical protein [Lysobacter humi (ex Lee et al. 2017)]